MGSKLRTWLAWVGWFVPPSTVWGWFGAIGGLVVTLFGSYYGLFEDEGLWVRLVGSGGLGILFVGIVGMGGRAIAEFKRDRASGLQERPTSSPRPEPQEATPPRDDPSKETPRKKLDRYGQRAAQRSKGGMANWTADHHLESDGRLKLWVKSLDADVMQPPRCVVQSEDGMVYENRFPFVDLFSKERSPDQGRWECLYPSDFKDAPDLPLSGHYEIRWFMGGGRSTHLVAPDEFDAPAVGGAQSLGVPAIPLILGQTAPSVSQGGRPGWTATCEPASPEGVFGRGVQLRLHGDGEATGVVCRVFDRRGGYLESGKSAFGVGHAGNDFTKHYPGEFGAPPLAKGSAPYRAVWLGNVGDPLVPDDVTLDEVVFDVDDVGRPACH